MVKWTDKQALAIWEKYNKGLAKNIDIDESLSRYDIDKMRERLEKDPVEWIKYFFPSYAKYEFAPFHIKAIKRLIENDEWYEVLSWSRELAKSTVVMFVLMYLTLTKRKKFVALASATIDAAVRLLTPYRINFESNTLVYSSFTANNQSLDNGQTESSLVLAVLSSLLLVQVLLLVVCVMKQFVLTSFTWMTTTQTRTAEIL